MVPVTIVTGFLGAGKSSLMNHVLSNADGRRIAVLVNDFGAVNIDAALIRGRDRDVIALENGCICCSLADGLVAAVASVLRRDDPPDHILIETSGVSDPVEIVRALEDPELARHAPLDGIVTLVDPLGFPVLEDEALRLGTRQIQVADLVLLNKADLCEEAELRLVEDRVRGIAPQARLLRTRQGALPLELLFGIDRAGADVTGLQPLPAALESFASTVLNAREPVPYAALERMLAGLPTSVFRVKGEVDLAERPDNRCILQATGTRATLVVGDAWDDDTPRTRLVFIGKKDMPPLAELTEGLFERAD